MSSDPITPPTVLVVDDDEGTRRLTVRWLQKAGITILEAASGEQALDVAIKHAEAIDAIVCDVMMPGIDGYETVRELKARAETAAIPVLLLTAHAIGEVDIVRSVEVGAVDHLVKPFSGPVLVAKVKATCERARAERRLRTQLVKAETSALVDPLTQLGNRRHFETRLREEAAYASRHKEPLTLAMLDVDHFKAINDTYGHPDGDRVLTFLAEQTKAMLRAGDSAFRFGGEEFVLLLRCCRAHEGVVAIERLRGMLRDKPIELGKFGEAKVVLFSAGLASADDSNGFSAEHLVARADEALYRAKQTGRNRSVVAP